MDEARTIRYVTPPAFFFGSLLLGAWLDKPDKVEFLLREDFQFIAAAAGAALFPLGFVFAGVTHFVFRLRFEGTDESYEAKLEKDSWDRIWDLLKFKEPQPEKTKMNKRNAAMTFDHEILPEETHASAVRLWSAFNISANSCTALVLSIPTGIFFLKIGWSCAWGLSVFTLFVTLFFSAKTTWERHMAFLDLQARRHWEKIKSAEKKE